MALKTAFWVSSFNFSISSSIFWIFVWVLSSFLFWVTSQDGSWLWFFVVSLSSFGSVVQRLLFLLVFLIFSFLIPVVLVFCYFFPITFFMICSALVRLSRLFLTRLIQSIVIYFQEYTWLEWHGQVPPWTFQLWSKLDLSIPLTSFLLLPSNLC